MCWGGGTKGGETQIGRTAGRERENRAVLVRITFHSTTIHLETLVAAVYRPASTRTKRKILRVFLPPPHLPKKKKLWEAFECISAACACITLRSGVKQPIMVL